MNIVRVFSFVFAGLFLASCAPNQLLRGLGLGGNEDKVEPYSCPLSFTPDQFRLQLKASQLIPSKVAVMIDGQLEYDECLSNPQISEGLAVGLRRSEPNTLDVIAYWFPEVKPTNMSFEIVDRGNCSAASSSFFVVNNMPVTFETHYYSEHQECGSYQSGEATVVQ